MSCQPRWVGFSDASLGYFCSCVNIPQSNSLAQVGLWWWYLSFGLSLASYLGWVAVGLCCPRTVSHGTSLLVPPASTSLLTRSGWTLRTRSGSKCCLIHESPFCQRNCSVQSFSNILLHSEVIWIFSSHSAFEAPDSPLRISVLLIISKTC